MSCCREYAELMAKMHKECGVRGSYSEAIVSYGKQFAAVTKTPLRKGPKKLCYMNAHRIAMLKRGYTYCEGIAYPAGLIPLPHAWVVDSKGLAHEVTWDEPAVDYFGVPFKKQFINDVALLTGVYGIFGHHHNRGVFVDKPEDFLAEVGCANATV